MHKSRPKNLNLFTISFPLPAIISILHRISGVFLFILIPFLIWGLALSLTEPGYASLQAWLSTVYVKCLFWILFVPFCFHLVAGIRHLLSDIHIGDTLKAGRLTAQIVLVVTVILVLLVGIWLW